MPFDLIPSKIWLERTALFGQRRSDQMKALDQALQSFEQRGDNASRAAVQRAFDTWKASKGPGAEWKKSDRNKKSRAIEDLDVMLRGQAASTERESKAYDALAEERQFFTKVLFEDRRVVLSGKAMLVYQGVASVHSGYSIQDNIRKSIAAVPPEQRGKIATYIGQGVENVLGNLLGDLVNDAEFGDAVAEVLGTTMSDLVTSITPALGLVKSGSMTAYSGLVTISKTRNVIGMHGAKVAFASGDPEQAFMAVQELAKREATASAIVLSSYAAETAAKTAGIMADGGTMTTAVVGIAASIARLLVTLGNLARDYNEKRKINNVLAKASEFNMHAFAENPLLGCYYVACATDSVLLNFMFGSNMALPGFMLEVEKAVKKHLDPTRQAATHCILNHRMMLSGDKFPKLSIDNKPSRIAVRNPATYQEITAKTMNAVRNREAGFYK